MTIFLLCLAGFVASFVDTIAGGGGLITVPAYMMAGLPSHMALGTNKFSATCGSFTSSFKFIKSGKADFRILRYALPFSLLGAVLGVNTALSINEAILSGLVTVLVMSIGVYSLFSKELGMEDNFKGVNKKTITYAIILAFVIGFYDGFFGPGTGSFLAFGMIKLFGYDFTRATANSKVMNFTSNVTSLVLYAAKGKIYYAMGIPVAIFVILGARAGTKVALNNGAKFIKPIFTTMSLIIAGKLLLDIFM